MPTDTIETYENGTLIDTQVIEVPPEVVNERSVHDKIEQAIEFFEGRAGTQAAWGALTAAQRTETTRLAVLGLAKVGRLLLRRFDSD